MLILTRHVGEKIRIGGTVVLLIISARESRVRIGIDAPKNTLVDRKEVRERKDRGGLRPTKSPTSEPNPSSALDKKKAQ